MLLSYYKVERVYSELYYMHLARTLSSRISFVAKMSENIKKDMLRAQRVQDNVLSNQYTVEMEAKLRSRVTV